jgi:hypothetical protein
MCGTFVREIREGPLLPACVVCGRDARGTLRRQAWDGRRGQPDHFVVPADPLNKAVAAEAVEDRE